MKNERVEIGFNLCEIESLVSGLDCRLRYLDHLNSTNTDDRVSIFMEGEMKTICNLKLRLRNAYNMYEMEMEKCK